MSPIFWSTKSLKKTQPALSVAFFICYESKIDFMLEINAYSSSSL